MSGPEDPSIVGRVSRHYFDHAATSPLLPAARAAWLTAVEQVGNPSSLHTSGRRARRILAEAREELAAAVGAHPQEVIFTSGGTEADNLAVLGAWTHQAPTKLPVIVSTIEHPAVAETAVAVRHRGAVVHHGPVTADGVVDLTDPVWRHEAAVVSVMSVNNETGVVQPLDALAGLVNTRTLHTDAVQALGHVPFHFAHQPAGLASLSAHKIGGPVGIGALLARRDAGLRPVVFGGRQEREVRSGTQAPALAAAFAAAATHAVAELATESRRLTELRDRLLSGLMNVADGVTATGATVDRSPAIAHLIFDGCRADDLLMLFDQAGVDCSTGSACTAGVAQPSDVLLAMGRTKDEARGALRFSLGWTTSDADVDALLAVAGDVITRARAAR